MLKDILLPLPADPQAVTDKAVHTALDAVAVLRGHLTAIVCQPSIVLPPLFRPGTLTVINEYRAHQEAVERDAKEQLARFEREAPRRGLDFEGRIVELTRDAGTDVVVEFARLRNLSLLPSLPDNAVWADLIQALIFGSGRPSILLPAEPAKPFKLDSIAVAWDFSRAASRAVQDALPVLERAKEVRAVIVQHEKWLANNPSGPEFAKHLARNGVNVTLQEVDLGARTVGEALDAAADGSDLLVMGAFGHSRIRDFFLGGATRHVLENAKLPVFLSH